MPGQPCDTSSWLTSAGMPTPEEARQRLFTCQSRANLGTKAANMAACDEQARQCMAAGGTRASCTPALAACRAATMINPLTQLHEAWTQQSSSGGVAPVLAVEPTLPAPDAALPVDAMNKLSSDGGSAWPIVAFAVVLAGFGVYKLFGKPKAHDLSGLSPRRRAALPAGAFVFPARRAWPLDTRKRAEAALRMSWWPQHAGVRCKVQKAVVEKFPGLKPTVERQRVNRGCSPRSCRCE